MENKSCYFIIPSAREHGDSTGHIKTHRQRLRRWPATVEPVLFQTPFSRSRIQNPSSTIKSKRHESQQGEAKQGGPTLYITHKQISQQVPCLMTATPQRIFNTYMMIKVTHAVHGKVDIVCVAVWSFAHAVNTLQPLLQQSLSSSESANTMVARDVPEQVRVIALIVLGSQ